MGEGPINEEAGSISFGAGEPNNHRANPRIIAMVGKYDKPKR